MSKLGKIFGAMLLLLSLWGLLEVPGAGVHGTWPASPLLILAMMVALVLGVLLALTPALARGRERLRAILLTSPDIVFYTGLFLAATLGYAVLTWRVFDGVPVLDDDVSSLMQARILATGHIRLPLPPHPEFFWIHCWLGVNQGLSHMCSMYPPGHPLVLLPGVLAGVPWLVTPLFGGALAVVTARAGQQLFNRATGRLAGVLSLGSPLWRNWPLRT